MEPFRVRVLDGVVRWVALSEEAPGPAACCEVLTDYPVAELDALLELEEDVPCRTRLVLSREPLHRAMALRRVAIDPAHGGRDRGVRGPINLEERHVVLGLARLLAAELEEAGARTLLLRDAGGAPPPESRLQAAAAWGAEMVVVLHTGHVASPDRHGTRTLFSPDCPRSLALARSIHGELLERLGLPDRGLAGLTGNDLPGPPPCPLVAVEPVCLSHPVEEALLRSKEFRVRIARAIRNGISLYVARLGVSGG